MYTRLINKDDIPDWLALAHEADGAIGKLIPDIAVFYKGFDDYLKMKIKKNEALMVVDSTTEKCAGIAAYSRKDNRITFLGVYREADFKEVGGKLLETVLSKLNSSREITVNLIKSDDDIIRNVRRLYEDNGFIEDEAEVIESGVPAFRMKRPPS